MKSDYPPDPDPEVIQLSDIKRKGGGFFMRLQVCLEEFYELYGHWPEILEISPRTYEIMSLGHLTPLGFRLMAERLEVRITPCPDDGLILLARDRRGNEFVYCHPDKESRRSESHTAPSAARWLWRIDPSKE